MKSKKTNILRLTLLAMLTAIILLVTCLPLQTLGLEISLAMVPISVGAVLLGPSGGAILGGIYGIFSFLQCLGFLKPSTLGIALYAINPGFTAVTCIVPRILCGLLAGLIFVAIQKIDRTKWLRYTLACLACPLLNTLFFMSALLFFFGQTDLIQGYMQQLGVYNPFLFVLAFVGINGLVEALTCFFIGAAISKALAVTAKKFQITL
ncbi:ECF transporter S component [Yeguia hominis]|uniref:ECF transporter S component n=1 Tax=Yeguia hominis TaxID=2763662 RepID=A0A926HS33_9FIRM|nr:ECF transporter S component [Yeguia hominis]MBC8532971.1 ECF transporter S component [Yeguia hominis]